MQPGFKLSISVSRNRDLNDMTIYATIQQVRKSLLNIFRDKDSQQSSVKNDWWVRDKKSCFILRICTNTCETRQTSKKVTNRHCRKMCAMKIYDSSTKQRSTRKRMGFPQKYICCWIFDRLKWYEDEAELPKRCARSMICTILYYLVTLRILDTWKME